MKESRESLGVCPSCEAVGSVGSLCGQRVCKRRGYHFIPGEHVPAEGEAPDPLVGKKVADYLVVDLVGSGGFGQVFLALQLPVRLKVALKLLDLRQVPPQMAPTVLEKFAGEANALASLHHPNIVRLLQYGDFEGKPYLVMEYLPDGLTLSDEVFRRVQAGASFELGELVDLFTQLLDAVEAVHAAGIIHRDLKPDNIMLQRVVGTPMHLRLLDFGLAKFIEFGDTTKHTLGTPQYMAPEQFGNADLGPWTDLYAVGVMAFELLSGQSPFGTADYHQILKRKLDVTFGEDQMFAAHSFPAPLEKVLRKALGRFPAGRFQQAAAMKEALLSALRVVETLPGGTTLPPLVALLDPSELRELTTSVGGEPATPSPSAGPGVSSDEAYERFLRRERHRLELEAERLAQTHERRTSSAPLPAPEGLTTDSGQPHRRDPKDDGG